MTLIDALVAARIEGPSVIAIGTFDGVHLGHQHLLRQVVEHARARAANAVVMTFHPRPAEVLRPDIPSWYLCSLDARIRFLKAAGIDVVVPLAFTRELSTMSADDFVGALVEHARLCDLIGGPDLALGRGRAGT
ncbi:MAG: adenylyltransferase/cytidyltransferase family protein, partial [Chloroflexota bacterium]